MLGGQRDSRDQSVIDIELINVADTAVIGLLFVAVYWLGVRKREWWSAAAALCFAVTFIMMSWLPAWMNHVTWLPWVALVCIVVEAFLPDAKRVLAAWKS
jgi:hypothetical protein